MEIGNTEIEKAIEKDVENKVGNNMRGENEVIRKGCKREN